MFTTTIKSMKSLLKLRLAKFHLSSMGSTFLNSQVCCDEKHTTLISLAVMYLEAKPCLNP